MASRSVSIAIRHSIFQRNDSYWTLAEQLTGQQSPTHLGRALEELGIQQIPAYSPQAKGRVERLWRTCQDRLVSELRLAQEATVEQANAVLAVFCRDYNQRFARPAVDSARDFRALPRRFDLGGRVAKTNKFPVPGPKQKINSLIRPCYFPVTI